MQIELSWLAQLALSLLLLRIFDAFICQMSYKSRHRGTKDGADDSEAFQSTTASARSVASSGELTLLTNAQLIGLTVALAGIEFVWATQMIFTVPIFERLGLSRRFLGVSWIAGPVSGLFVQPIAGAWSSC